MDKFQKRRHLAAICIGLIAHYLLAILIFSDSYKKLRARGFTEEYAREYAYFPDLFFDGFIIVIPVYIIVMLVFRFMAKSSNQN